MKTNSLFWKGVLVLLCIFSISSIFAQTPSEVREIIKDYDLAALRQMEQSSTKLYLTKRSAAEKRAQLLNIPLTLTLADGGFAELQDFTPSGDPVYYRTLNVAAARSTRTNHLHIGGSLGFNLEGQNMTARVWDGGHPRVSHQEYDGPGGNNRVTTIDAGSLNFHAAHVTGTIAASGVNANAKGMAPQARVENYQWSNDLGEAVQAAANGMLLSNHSYGYNPIPLADYFFGGYTTRSRDWDNLMYNAPHYLMVVAAGNDGNTNYNGAPLNGANGFDKLTGFATSKNNLVVANAQDANVNTQGDLLAVTINSGSSEGPTDDLRIKPDITGNGTSVFSTYHSNDSDYNSITGTSMASPNVTGSLLLLQQYFNQRNGQFMRAATLKGLALHTADDAGPAGPDVVYGWGLLNAKRAAETIEDNQVTTIIEEHTLQPGGSFTMTVNSDGIAPLMASISWTDPAGVATTVLNSPTPRLINDLDIRITKAGTTFTPYRLTSVTTNGTGDNNVDPYERVDVNGASGAYTITVTHKGSLSLGSQDFSLIVTGISLDIAPPLNLVASNVTASTVDLDWTASVSPDIDGYKIYQNGVEVATSTNTNFTVTGLTPQTTYSFYVRAYSGSEQSDPSNTVTITTLADTVAPNAPFFITVSMLTETSALLSWNVPFDNVGVVGYDVYLDGNLVGSPTTNALPLSGLSPATYYTAFVRAKDAAGNISGNSNVRTFRTLGLDCSTNATLPYTEGFESSIGLWTQDPTNTTDWIRNSGGTSGSGPTTGSGGSTWYMYVEAAGNAFKSAIMVSPCVDLTNETQATFSFDYYVGLSLMPERFACQVSADGVNWDTLWNTSDAVGNGWQTFSAPLDAYLGQEVQFRFRRQVSSNSILDVAVDNINITNGNSSPLYCTSNASNTQVAYLDRVRVGTINNQSGASLGGYEDFTGLSTTLSRTTTNTIRITPIFPGSRPNAGIAVYIDWNQDGDFNDFGEQAISYSGFLLGTYNGSISVPFFATPGSTRMRVSFQQGGTVPGSCGLLFSGEVEDYTVIIPNSLTGSDISMEIEKSNVELQLYPNPVRSQFLNVTLTNDQPVRYGIFNALGVQIMTARYEEHIDVSRLTSGTYFIEVASANKIYRATFIKD